MKFTTKRKLPGVRILESMSLDAELDVYLKKRAVAGRSGMMDGSLASSRAEYATEISGGTITSVPCTEVLAGPVPIRVFRPSRGHSDVGIVFVHGGGWVLGGGDAYDPVAGTLASLASAPVFLVDYRLAPEHPFPAGWLDVFESIRWLRVTGQVPELGLVGDSAGGGMAPSLAAALAERACAPAAQLLFYPSADAANAYPSLNENGEGYLLTFEDIRKFGQMYFGERVHRRDPRASPVLGEFDGVGPTVVVTAGYDPLRDSGFALCDRLRAQHVPTDHFHFGSMTHGFLGLTEVSATARSAVAETVKHFVALFSGVAGV